jgi:23S rRNA (adenine2030-N6)-methyltransferase
MLSYQHMYHAGNLADVHKHMLMAALLDYMTAKDKPLTYIETHAGRGLYDLSATAALKTGEAAAGIEALLPRLDPAHPYTRVLTRLRAEKGEKVYPGSPLIAALLLRPGDSLHLAELHPAECAALRETMTPYPARCHHRDGFELALSLCPPTPRRGLVMIDPSWEIKTDYVNVPRQIARITRAWNVGIVALWYPILRIGAHRGMLAALCDAYPEALRHEVGFPPAREGHGMVGSGMFVINPPFGLEADAALLTTAFRDWFPGAGKP